MADESERTAGNRVERSAASLTSARLAGFLAAFYGAWAIRATVLHDALALMFEGWRGRALSMVLAFVMWVLPTFALARTTGDTKTTLRLGRPVRLKEATFIAVGFLALSVPMALLRGYSFAPSRLAAIGGHLVAPFAEEIVFRGLLLTHLESRVRSWTAQAIVAAAFVAVHLPHWLWVHGPVGTMTRLVPIVPTTFVLGLLAARTRSIWPSVALHAANNAISMSFVPSR